MSNKYDITSAMMIYKTDIVQIYMTTLTAMFSKLQAVLFNEQRLFDTQYPFHMIDLP